MGRGGVVVSNIIIDNTGPGKIPVVWTKHKTKYRGDKRNGRIWVIYAENASELRDIADAIDTFEKERKDVHTPSSSN